MADAICQQSCRFVFLEAVSSVSPELFFYNTDPVEQVEMNDNMIKVYETVMRRAIELSSSGPARGVNPQVGAIALDPNGNIIAEGWHMGSGTPHAEVDALSKLSPEQIRGATMVVTLEPCNHTGRTGPCAGALVEAGVARVVYAVTDPGHESSGGAERLRAAGIEVIGGVLANEVEAHQSSWLTAARLGRPHVTVKWAGSLDGRAAAEDGTSQWISGPESRELVHHQRSAADAIIVGTGTVLADNPSLTARTTGGDLHNTQPVPVIIGERPIPGDSLIYQHPHAPIVPGTRDIEAVLAELHGRGLRSVYVEGGPTLASAFIEAGVVDRYYVFLAPTVLGGPRLAITDIGVGSLAERVDLDLVRVDRVGQDIFIEAHPRKEA
jgi:diaminohydroxyphosphoribosylaminopyrimidine deaminase/5-amino-6-(5-phosphoribosylamino)uracil reductase